MTKQDYIDAYGESARQACEGSHIFPLLALAESAVESGWGESMLTKQAFNFFGIKSTRDWEGAGGEIITKQTREVVDGHSVMVNAAFRKYTTATDSFKDYVRFISGTRYVNAGVLSATTPEEQIAAISAAGYATDPTYAKLIINVIQGLKSLFNA